MCSTIDKQATVVRILVYEGDLNHIEHTLRMGTIPAQGSYEAGDLRITSGIVDWTTLAMDASSFPQVVRGRDE